MPKIDQFESVFRHATREIYEYAAIHYDSVLVVTDRDASGAEAVTTRTRKLLKAHGPVHDAAWRTITGDELGTVEDLLRLVESEGPTLVCTYRNLQSVAWQWPYSLGEYLDVLCQATEPPVLVLPHPDSDRAAEHALTNTDVVMAMTDHLDGDDRLVNHAVSFVEKDGSLILAHVEDGITFDRYIDTIAKIPTIDTDNARETILAQLVADPTHYIESCRQGLSDAGVPVEVHAEVRMGHHIAEYKRLVEQHRVDLLVLNTKDEDQLAMHGMAYPVAVELREIPLLML